MEETNKMNEETEKVEHQDVNQQENVTPESVQEVIEEATTAEPTSTEPKVENPQETSVKKQRHHFADKGLSSQVYGLSSNHTGMCELDLYRRLSTKESMLLNCGASEDS